MEPLQNKTKNSPYLSKTENKGTLGVGKLVQLKNNKNDIIGNYDELPSIEQEKHLKGQNLSDLQNDLKRIDKEDNLNFKNTSEINSKDYKSPNTNMSKFKSEDTDDNNLISSKLIKPVQPSEISQDTLNPLESEMNILNEDKNKFIGEFWAGNYKLIRGYLHSSTKQVRLYYTKFEPIGIKLASLCIIHGFGEHSGRYLEMAEHFTKKGFIVHMIDLRGFGYSGGARGNSTIENLHMDIETLLKQAHRDLPLFVYGHSMGGGLIASLLIRNPYLNIAGAILTSPLIGFPKERNIPWHKKFIVKLIADDLEEVLLNGLISPTTLTKSNTELKLIYEDRLLLPLVTMKMAKGLFMLVDYVLPNARKFKYPCLILHGKEDGATSCDASIRFYNKISSEDKVLKIFPEGFHELHRDKEKESVKSIVTDWMIQRLKTNPKKIGNI